MLLQIHDATEAVKQIGLSPAVLIMVLLAAGTAGVGLFRYFSNRLDKKDERILTITDERREDLARMVESQQVAARGQEKIVDALTTLADEIRREPRKQR